MQDTNKTKSIPFMPLRLMQCWIVAIMITHQGSHVTGNSHEMMDEVALLEGNNGQPTDEAVAQLVDEVKRSWQSLQGSWGKRDSAAAAPISEIFDIQEPDWSSSGPNEINENPELRYSVIYASSPNALAAAVDAAASASSNCGQQAIEDGTESDMEKRSWKNMNVAWGKRRSAVWNKFRGAWGKREPGWNNLKGMWGKRSSNDWKKLQSAWGKRNPQQQIQI